MQVTLYSEFSKRKNSTKQPTNDTPHTDKELRLKDKCSYIRPSFFIAMPTNTVYVKAWDNYYFVEGIERDIYGATYINCLIDVLATFKQQILDTYAFVAYSSSNYDVNIHDNRIAQKITKHRNTEYTPSNVFLGNSRAGCYIVTVANAEGIKTYAMDETNFNQLSADLVSGGQSLWESLQQLFGDAMGGIVSARYVPIALSKFTNFPPTDHVYIGDYSTDCYAYDIDPAVPESVEITIPWTYSDFRRSSDYTKIVLGLPFIGAVELSPDNLVGKTSVTVEMICNVATGVINYAVWSTDDIGQILLISTYSGSFGRQIPLATDQVDAMGAVNSGIAAGTSAALGMVRNIAEPLAMSGYGAGVAASTAVIGLAIKSMIAANKQDFTVIGGYNGGYGEVIFHGYYLFLTSIDSRTDPSELTTLYGRPCAKVLQISSLSGYVETKGFSIDLSEVGEIKRMINDMMDTGVYLE